jgi:quercetin dioxygenase-like cupin family protein
MRRTHWIIGLCGTIAMVAALDSAGPPTLKTAKELSWTDGAEPAGMKQVLLWGDPKVGDHGLLVRWKSGTKLPERVSAHGLDIVVLTGTFTIETGGVYKEFGPGGYLGIPGGTKHILGCEAAGECKFLVHRRAPADVTP